MYTLKSVLAVPMGINKRWGTVPLTTTASVLATHYRKAFLTVTAATDPNTDLVLPFEQFVPRYANYPGTLQQMFTDFADAPVTTTTSAARMEQRTAKAVDGRQSRYTAVPVHPTLGLNAPESQRTDLLLTRPDIPIDYSYFARRAMVSVNGYYHMIDTDGVSGVWIKDGAKSKAVCNQCQYGIYSFHNVCPITHVPITASMLQKRATVAQAAGTVPMDPFSSVGYIKINQDLTNKTVLFVIGGYLIPPDTAAIRRVNDNEFEIQMGSFPMVDRYYESRHYLDLSFLGLPTSISNPSAVSLADLLSDAVLMRYFTLPQSFAVILDMPDVFVNRYHVRRCGTPGIYESYQDPKYPLQTSLGRCPEFWVTTEGGRWQLSAYEDYLRNKIYRLRPVIGDTIVTGTPLPADPDDRLGAYLLEIGRDVTAYT